MRQAILQLAEATGYLLGALLFALPFWQIGAVYVSVKRKLPIMKIMKQGLPSLLKITAAVLIASLIGPRLFGSQDYNGSGHRVLSCENDMWFREYVEGYIDYYCQDPFHSVRCDPDTILSVDDTIECQTKTGELFKLVGN